MSYFDVFCHCLKKKKFFAIPIVVGVLCFFLAWILPPVFKTEIRLKIDASSDSSPMTALSTAYKSLTSSGASGLSSFLSSAKAMKPSDLYLEILSGREIALSTIHKFHLDTMYKKESDELLLKKLSCFKIDCKFVPEFLRKDMTVSVFYPDRILACIKFHICLLERHTRPIIYS